MMKINKAQNTELRQLFATNYDYDTGTYHGKQDMVSDIYDILKEHEPDADEESLHLKALTIGYINCHNESDGRDSQMKQTKQVLDK